MIAVSSWPMICIVRVFPAVCEGVLKNTKKMVAIFRLLEEIQVDVGIICLGGGFKYFLFSPLFGEDSHFDKYFSKGLKPPTSYCFFCRLRSLKL